MKNFVINQTLNGYIVHTNSRFAAERSVVFENFEGVINFLWYNYNTPEYGSWTKEDFSKEAKKVEEDK